MKFIKSLILVKLLSIVFLLSGYSHAGLYKCIDESGQLGFSDVPCAEDTKQVTLQKEYDKRGFRTDFFKNPGTSDVARCTQALCRCGSYSHELDGDAVKQLTRTAMYLETAWINHKHARKNKSSTKSYNCKIKVHQKIFNRLYPVVLKQQVAMYRMSNFAKGEARQECGSEPASNSQGGWTSDRTYIKWYQCNERHNRSGMAKSNRKQKRQFERLESALTKLR